MTERQLEQFKNTPKFSHPLSFHFCFCLSCFLVRFYSPVETSHVSGNNRIYFLTQPPISSVCFFVCQTKKLTRELNTENVQLYDRKIYGLANRSSHLIQINGGRKKLQLRG
ncbi:CLUMA_CG001644, isoform A [Clunio marinus]|uniref:CLUMA_CG001644, isoform A n=1 Tax=Clunio marinus TaxID=568069 RepID=A0A1J1HNQ3_9DIPT|nr:CLUMA_CG001644, isoform A [Clunio marinus]